MSGPVWTFAERSQLDVEQEVTEADQFNSETVNLSEALVREAAQNSQDAGIDDRTVRLRIGLADPDPAYLDGLLKDLLPHLDAAGFERPGTGAGTRALVIEDFGTKGLTGAVDDHASTDNFRSFFFRHGGSYKTGAQNGRWGLGKLVFPLSSNARCFFGLTRRTGDPHSAYLLGEAVLRTHHQGNRKFAPHGHFGCFDGSRILPVTDGGFLDRFSAEFSLERKGETGLSVVVPCPASEFDRDGLTRLVARNYIWPILSGSLVVDVMGRTIDRESITRDAAGLLPNGFVDFAQRIIGTGRDGLTTLREPGLKPGGVREPADELVDQDAVDDLRAAFAAGDLAGFAIPVPLGRKGGEVEARSGIRVFLARAPEGSEGGALYVRKDITVPDEARSFSGKGIFAAMIADRGEVAEFLADAENPAHTSWSGQADRLRKNWKYPGQTLSFIRNAPARLHQLLTTGVEVEVRNALLDFFWVDEPDQAKSGGSRGRGERGKPNATGEPPTPPPPRPRRIQIDRQQGGFAIRGDTALGEIALPRTLRVRLGYDIESGNAVREWDPADFDLSDRSRLAEAVSGASVEAQGNEILIEITDPDFSYSLTGFDSNRDLVVETALVSGS